MGASIFAAFLLGISFIVLAIASGFLADATRRVAGLSQYPSNKDLSTAHHWGTIGSIVGWITIALILIAGILYIFFLGETALESGGIAATLLLFLALVGNILVGVFAAMTAYYINKSGVDDNNLSYRNSVIAAVLAIISFVAIVIVFFVKIFYKPKTKEQKETEKQIAELKEELNREERMPIERPPPPPPSELPSFMHERYADQPDDEFDE